MKFSIKLSLVAVFCLVPSTAFAFGNDDVIKLITAGFSEDMVLKAVATTDAATFDTSADGLIKLRNAGASDAVIQKILARQNENQPLSQAMIPATVPVATGGNCQFEAPVMANMVSVRVEGKIIPLPSQDAEVVRNVDGMSALAFGFTFGAIKGTTSSSLRINGERSSARMAERTPEFLDLIIPSGASPETILSLVHLTVKEQSRVVQIATQETSRITGNSERTRDFGENVRVPLVAERVADNCIWRRSQWAHYKMKPASPLEKGEYGFMIYRRLYDFAVD